MLGAIAVAFTSCNNNDEEESATLLITSTMPQSEAPGVERVVAATWGDDETSHVVAYSRFTSLGFSLLLDATPNAGTIMPISYLWDGLTISNTDARIAMFWDIEGFTSTTGAFLDTDFAGWFFRVGVSGAEETGFYMADEFFVYATRAVSITGEESGTDWVDYFNINLVQGWNRVFTIYSERTEGGNIIDVYETTTTPVTGMEWSWIFESDNGNGGEHGQTAMRVNAQENSAAARVAERVAQRRSDRR